jgi:putative ABC transport system permease protein
VTLTSVLVLAFRRPEIGIRMALGASAAGVVRLIAREGLTLVGAGAAHGLAGSLLLTRFLGTVLYGIRADDPGTYAAVMVVLLVCSAAACVLPAFDAARIDPASALR